MEEPNNNDPESSKKDEILFLSLTERSVVILCVQRAVAKFVFLPKTGIWLISNGVFLQEDMKNSIRYLIDQEIASLDDFLRRAKVENPDTRREIRKKINALDHNRVIRDIKHRLEASPRLVREADNFNRLPDQLNTLNGVIDLKTTKLLPLNPLAWTKACSVKCGKEKTVPTLFLKFIHEFCCERKDLADYLLRYLGYAITGSVEEQSLMVLKGSGGNGKSVLFEVIGYILGSFFGKIEKTVLVTKFDASTHAMTDLDGLRIALIAETSKDDVWDDGRVKQLTGEIDFIARGLYKSNKSYRNTAKIFVYTNSVPHSRANDEGFYRRLKIFPCDMRISKELRNPNLSRDLIRLEGPAILQLLTIEAAAWYKDKLLPEPECMHFALEDFQNEHDQLKTFLTSCTEAMGTIVGTKLFEMYQHWCKQQNEPALKKTTFYQNIEQRGYRRIRDPHKETISFFGLSPKEYLPE